MTPTKSELTSFYLITLPTWVTLSTLIAVPIIFGPFSWQDSKLTSLIALSVFTGV